MSGPDPLPAARWYLPGRLPNLLFCLLALWMCLMASRTWAADSFLDPDKAFRLSARMAGAQEIEAVFSIAPGYYLYRDRLTVTADGASLGEPRVPAGKIKFDENFQKNVETLRGELRIAIPLRDATGPFTLRVGSQGCADAGLCYPPQTAVVRLDPAGPINTSAPMPAPRPTGSTGLAAWLDGSIVEQVLQDGGLWRSVGVFWLIGVLLSLTPCVLPMLPILSSIIVGSGQRPTRVRGLALAASYSLGMALVYTALGVAAGLVGEGLAAALQTPWALGGFALLLVLFSLSMFDVYELRLPHGFTTQMSAQCDRMPAGQLAGVFVMGGLSALIVSPCVTAPLAAALLFISQTRDVVLGGAALFAMAIGMCVPLLLLGVSSGRWLPRSGPWMHTVKRLFGTLMLGLAIWIARPVLPAQLVLGLWGLLLLLVGVMLRPFGGVAHHRHAVRTWGQRALGVAALVLGVAEVVGAASGGRDAWQPLAHLGEAQRAAASPLRFTRVRSVAELDAVLATAQRPAMLDFYADWCVSCKEMERFTFHDAEVAARLDKVLLLKVDVTGNSDSDHALLRRFKLFGPPGTLFFDPQGREIGDARVVGFQTASRFRRSLDQAGL